MFSNSAYITGLNIRSLGSIQMYAVNFLALSLKGKNIYHRPRSSSRSEACVWRTVTGLIVTTSWPENPWELTALSLEACQETQSLSTTNLSLTGEFYPSEANLWIQSLPSTMGQKHFPSGFWIGLLLAFAPTTPTRATQCHLNFPRWGYFYDHGLKTTIGNSMAAKTCCLLT